MSDFLFLGPCEACGSSDAKAHFDDGHKWCFSCQTFTPPTDLDRLENLKPANDNNNKNKPIGHYSLPDTFSYSIPSLGLDWLKKYEITEKEIATHHIGWAEHKHVLSGYLHNNPEEAKPNYGHVTIPMLVFPLIDFADGITVGWQGRLFPMPGIMNRYKPPKYFTKKPTGFRPIYQYEGDKHSVVLVEDITSAIKVNRQMSCMPCMGSGISKEDIVKLSKLYRRIVIWLDHGMERKAAELSKDATPYFDQVEVVNTIQDPKGCSDDIILSNVYNV